MLVFSESHLLILLTISVYFSFILSFLQLFSFSFLTDWSKPQWFIIDFQTFFFSNYAFTTINCPLSFCCISWFSDLFLSDSRGWRSDHYTVPPRGVIFPKSMMIKPIELISLGWMSVSFLIGKRFIFWVTVSEGLHVISNAIIFTSFLKTVIPLIERDSLIWQLFIRIIFRKKMFNFGNQGENYYFRHLNPNLDQMFVFYLGTYKIHVF